MIKGPHLIEAQIHVSGQRPVWVLSHPHPQYGGTMQNKIIDQLYKRAVERNIFVVRYNFRGVGQSEGTFDHGQGEQEDLQRVLAYLADTHGIENSNIHLIGYSFGSYVSAMCAGHINNVAKLSLIAPPTQWFTFPKLKGIYPVEVYMPEQDEHTDMHHAKAYVDQLRDPKSWIEIKAADHFFIGSTKRLIDSFLGRNT